MPLPTPQPTTIYYIVDPMCSWCWGFRDTLLEFKKIASATPDIHWQYVMGGLAPDNDQAMPQHMQEMIQSHWHAVASRTGAKFNFDFWTTCQARRSTWPSCRAVIAAGLQGDEYIPAMLQGIQEAYYLRAENPSDNDCLHTVASRIGLDSDRFIDDFNFNSDSVCQLFEEQRKLSHQLGVSGFPALVASTEHTTNILCAGYMELDTLLQRWQNLMDS